MNGVTFSGLASGLDTNSIVTQLVELKRAPIYRLQARRSGYEAQIKALDTFKSKLLAFQTAAKKLDSAGEFSSVSASVANEDALTVEASTDAAAGSYEINVTRLAEPQKDISQGFDSKLDSMGEGLMSFTVNGETTDLNLSGYTSLESLANRINNDVAGVSASIIYDGSETGGYHLVMSSSKAGSDGAFSVDMSGMSGGSTPIMTNSQPAQDAQLTIDDIVVTAKSNNPTDVISGLTLNLLDATEGPTIVKIEADIEGISDTVKEMVDSYNDLFGYISAQSTSEGDLRDNPTMRAVASRIEGIFTSSLSGGLGDVTRFSQIGITRGDARQIEFDEDDFKDMLDSDFGGVRDLFIERDGNLGKMYLVDQSVEDMTDSLDGLFKISTKALNNKIDNADSSIERYERSIESYQTTLTRKFTAMEQMVSQLQSQGSYLSAVTY